MKRAVPPAPPGPRRPPQPQRPVPQKAPASQAPSSKDNEVAAEVVPTDVYQQKEQLKSAEVKPLKAAQPIPAEPRKAAEVARVTVPVGVVGQKSTLSAGHESLQEMLRKVKEGRKKLQSSLIESDLESSSEEAEEFSELVEIPAGAISKPVERKDEAAESNAVIQAVESSSQQSQPKLQEVSSSEGSKSGADSPSKHQPAESLGDPKPIEEPELLQRALREPKPQPITSQPEPYQFEYPIDPYRTTDIELPVDTGSLPYQLLPTQHPVSQIKDNNVLASTISEYAVPTVSSLENHFKADDQAEQEAPSTHQAAQTSAPAAQPMPELKEYPKEVGQEKCEQLLISICGEGHGAAELDDRAFVVLLRERYDRLKEESLGSLSRLEERQRQYLERIRELKAALQRQDALIGTLVELE